MAFDKAATAFRYLAGLAHHELPGGLTSLAALPGAGRIERSGRTPSVLCLHGFGGVPLEVAVCAEVATELGLSACAPVLAGHGTLPRDTARLGFDDWLDGARADFYRLSRQGPVILAGLSLGSLLATALVLEAPGDVAGLVLMANAFWLNWPMPGGALALVDRLRLPDIGVPKTAGPDLGDAEAKRTHISYAVQPVHAAIQVLRAGERLRQDLFRVHCRTLILHGALDSVCPVSNSWRASALMTDAETRLVVLPRSRHILTRDFDREIVRRELRTFFEQVAGQG